MGDEESLHTKHASHEDITREILGLSLFERLLYRLTRTSVLAPDTLETVVDDHLGYIAAILEIDRISIHEFNNDTMLFERTQEWRSDDFPEAPITINAQQFPRIVERLRAGDVVHTKTARHVTGLAPRVRRARRRRSPKTREHHSLIVPLYTNERLLGTLTFTNFEDRPLRPWRLAQLQLLGVILTGALEYRRIHEESQLHLHAVAHIARVVSLSGLTTSIAHDINQPLTAILSNAQVGARLVDEPEWNAEDIRAIFNDIAAEVIRIGGLVRHMHGLFKNQESKITPCRLNEVVQSVIRLTRSDTIIHQVRVTEMLDPTDPVVLGDYVQLQQIVLNLLKNAIEAFHTVSENCPRHIVVSTTLIEPHQAQVLVRDSGPGILPEDLQRVFNSFFTTKPQGLGVGLSISRSLASANKGVLWGVNNPEGGASFYLSLPRLQEKR